jgi:1-acyl-sn-glycerol-3-phosphate acyltransferase
LTLRVGVVYYSWHMDTRILKSLMIWVVGGTLTVILYFVMLLCVLISLPFDNKKRKLVHAQCFWWSDAIFAMNPFWRIRVSGLENIDHKKTYVVVANHQSMADIVVIYQTRMQFKWVAKDSLFRIPVLGWELSLARHIRLERGDFSSIKNIYRRLRIGSGPE